MDAVPLILAILISALVIVGSAFKWNYPVFELCLFMFWITGYILLLIRTIHRSSPTVWYKFATATVSAIIVTGSAWYEFSYWKRPVRPQRLPGNKRPEACSGGCFDGLDFRKFGNTSDDRLRLLFCMGNVTTNMAAIFAIEAWRLQNEPFGNYYITWWCGLQPAICTLLCIDYIMRFTAYLGRDMSKATQLTIGGRTVFGIEHPEVFTTWLAEALSDISLAVQWQTLTALVAYVICVWILPTLFTVSMFKHDDDDEDDDDAHWVHDASHRLRLETHHRIRVRLTIIMFFALLNETYMSIYPERPNIALFFCISAYVFAMTTVVHFVFIELFAYARSNAV